MKKFKSLALYALVLALTAVVLLAGCSNAADAPATTTAAGTTTTTAAETTTTTAAETTAADEEAVSYTHLIEYPYPHDHMVFTGAQRFIPAGCAAQGMAVRIVKIPDFHFFLPFHRKRQSLQR